MLSEVVTCICVRNPGGTRNRTQDLPKKGSASITCSDHWTDFVLSIEHSQECNLQLNRLVNSAMSMLTCRRSECAKIDAERRVTHIGCVVVQPLQPRKRQTLPYAWTSTAAQFVVARLWGSSGNGAGAV